MIELVFVVVLAVLVLLGVFWQLVRIADAVEAQNRHYEIGVPPETLQGPELEEAA